MKVDKIRLDNSIIRNPILVSCASKGILPYRGLGSVIKRALDTWAEIDFIDDRDGCLFTAIVHRKTELNSRIVSVNVDDSPKSSEKSSEKIRLLLRTCMKLRSKFVWERFATAIKIDRIPFLENSLC